MVVQPRDLCYHFLRHPCEVIHKRRDRDGQVSVVCRVVSGLSPYPVRHQTLKLTGDIVFMPCVTITRSVPMSADRKRWIRTGFSCCPPLKGLQENNLNSLGNRFWSVYGVDGSFANHRIEATAVVT